MHIEIVKTIKPVLGSAFLLLMLCSAPREVLAQGNNYVPQTHLRAAYMGALIHPGLMLGIDRPYKVTQVDHFNPRKTRTVYLERYLSFNLGMYHHQTFHTNLMALLELGARRQYPGGLYLQTNAGLGLSRTFLDGAAYEVDESGEVFKVPLAGDFYALASMAFSIGHKVLLGDEAPGSVFVRPRLTFLAPYNGLALPRLSMEVGATWSPLGFWSANPRNDYKTKTKKSAKR